MFGGVRRLVGDVVRDDAIWVAGLLAGVVWGKAGVAQNASIQVEIKRRRDNIEYLRNLWLIWHGLNGFQSHNVGESLKIAVFLAMPFTLLKIYDK